MKLSKITDFIGFTNSQVDAPQTPTQPIPDPENLGPKEVYLTWQALARPVRKAFNKKFMRNAIVIGVVVSLLLVIMGEYFLILVVASMIFISHVLSSTPPETVSYEVSSHGVMIADRTFHWNTLKQFFFMNNGGSEMLGVDTREALPGRLFLTINPADKEKLKEIFSRYLTYLNEEPMSAVNKAYSSILNKFNFE
jgi:hypothetical protein